MPRLPGALSRFVNAMMFRVLRSRRFQNANVLSLTTTGARTGEQRRTTLVYFPDGDNRILIVGSGGGTASYPAWFFNIARHPDRVWVNLGDRQFKVAPDLARRLGPAPRYRRRLVPAPVHRGFAARRRWPDPLRTTTCQRHRCCWLAELCVCALQIRSSGTRPSRFDARVATK